MRIDAQFGEDTGMFIVDVYLESELESAFSDREVWVEMQPLLRAQGVPVTAVIDFFLLRQDSGGEWVSGGTFSPSEHLAPLP